MERVDRLYPFITGLVAGASISPRRRAASSVWNGETHLPPGAAHCARLPAGAPLPLQLHLGHPEALAEMYFTPHSTSAMAMFGYVYLWYLMAVLVLENLARLPPRPSFPLFAVRTQI